MLGINLELVSYAYLQRLTCGRWNDIGQGCHDSFAAAGVSKQKCRRVSIQSEFDATKNCYHPRKEFVYESIRLALTLKRAVLQSDKA
jgi:hypothetical protein